MLQRGTGRSLLDEMRVGLFGQYDEVELAKLDREIEYTAGIMEDMKRKASSGNINEEISINYFIIKAHHERCVRIKSAYIWNRLMRIEQNYYKKEKIRHMMNRDEMEFEKEFMEITEEYLEAYKQLDLNHRDIPLNFYVQIYTLVDCGIVMCGDELINLQKDRIYFMRRSEVAHLIDKKMAKIV